MCVCFFPFLDSSFKSQFISVCNVVCASYVCVKLPERNVCQLWQTNYGFRFKFKRHGTCNDAFTLTFFFRNAFTLLQSFSHSLDAYNSVNLFGLCSASKRIIFSWVFHCFHCSPSPYSQFVRQTIPSDALKFRFEMLKTNGNWVN